MTTINIVKLQAELRALVKQLSSESDKQEVLRELQPGEPLAEDEEGLKALLKHVQDRLSGDQETQPAPEVASRVLYRSKFKSAEEMDEHLDEVIFPVINEKIRLLKTDKMGSDAFAIIDPSWILGDQKFVIYHKADDVRNRLASIGIPEYVSFVMDKEESRPVNVLKQWHKTALAQELRLVGLCYKPSSPLVVDRKFNTYKDVSVPADPTADCSPILWLIRENLCNGNTEYYEFILNYLAHMMQKTEERPFTAYSFRGPEGIGKGIFAEVIQRMMGGSRNCSTTASHQDIKRFNTAIAEKISLIFDESIFSGDHEQSSFMRTLVTEARVRVEPKGIDAYEVENYARVGLLTNNSQSGSTATIGGRREITIETTTDASAEMQEKLKRLSTQIGLNRHDETTIPNCINGFKHLLMTRDISQFNSQALPQQTTGIDGKINNSFRSNPLLALLTLWLNAPDLTLYISKIERVDGREYDVEEPLAWGAGVPFASFYRAFQDACRDAFVSRPPGKNLISKDLKKYGIVLSSDRDRQLLLPHPAVLLAELRKFSRFDSLVTPEQEAFINAYAGGYLPTERPTKDTNVLILNRKVT